MTFQQAVQAAESEEPNGSQQFDGGAYRQWYSDVSQGIVNWLVDYDGDGNAEFVQRVGTADTWVPN